MTGLYFLIQNRRRPPRIKNVDLYVKPRSTEIYNKWVYRCGAIHFILEVVIKRKLSINFTLSKFMICLVKKHSITPSKFSRD